MLPSHKLSVLLQDEAEKILEEEEEEEDDLDEDLGEIDSEEYATEEEEEVDEEEEEEKEDECEKETAEEKDCTEVEGAAAMAEKVEAKSESIEKDTDQESDVGAKGGSLNSPHMVTGDELLDLLSSVHTGTKYKEGVTTIGLVGYPNVGKSSTINALLRTKKVSVSATPGHTKHFQVGDFDWLV